MYQIWKANAYGKETLVTDRSDRDAALDAAENTVNANGPAVRVTVIDDEDMVWFDTDRGGRLPRPVRN